MARHLFCRDLSIERGEPLVGTGSLDRRVVLMAWPRGKWRVPRFESADMSLPLSSAIRTAMGAGIHLALVDRVGETNSIAQLQVDDIAADFSDEAQLAAALEGIAAGQRLTGRHDGRIVILCCTDSRRDACCARYGFETFKALRAAADPTLFNVLQCTHVGGCRFAASLVVLPHHQRYGRLTPTDVPAFLAALGNGESTCRAIAAEPTCQKLPSLPNTLRWRGHHQMAALCPNSSSPPNGLMKVRLERNSVARSWLALCAFASSCGRRSPRFIPAARKWKSRPRCFPAGA